MVVQKSRDDPIRKPAVEGERERGLRSEVCVFVSFKWLRKIVCLNRVSTSIRQKKRQKARKPNTSIPIVKVGNREVKHDVYGKRQTVDSCVL